MKASPPRWLALVLLANMAAVLSSCRTAKSVVEAVEVQPSSFLTHAKDLKEDRKHSPFLGNWWNRDKSVLAAADRCRKIYVAPVLYANVRPDKTLVAAVEHDAGWRRRRLPVLAGYMKDQFEAAFSKAKEPRYAVVQAPAADALTLELNLLEWGPNTYTGVITRQAVDFFTFNVGGEVALRNTRGYMAIEGRVVEPKSKQPVFEFADKEYAKVVILISIQDFRRYGQAHFAVKEWAAQLEKLLRSRAGERVADSSPAVLFNY
ncbi:DUF3313 family protein [Prosthecobacter sp.]|uniref:DUF3313 family protein n=1 Tax=Prosthecobacter sp. TaxID=1965333 RepID=UPI0037835883